MIPIILAAVGGFLMLLGVGLMVGGVVAFAKPTKVVPGSNPEQRVADWPVVSGLVLGGIAAFVIGWTMLKFINPAGKLGHAKRLADFATKMNHHAGGGDRRHRR